MTRPTSPGTAAERRLFRAAPRGAFTGIAAPPPAAPPQPWSLGILPDPRPARAWAARNQLRSRIKELGSWRQRKTGGQRQKLGSERGSVCPSGHAGRVALELTARAGGPGRRGSGLLRQFAGVACTPGGESAWEVQRGLPNFPARGREAGNYCLPPSGTTGGPGPRADAGLWGGHPRPNSQSKKGRGGQMGQPHLAARVHSSRGFPGLG